MNKIDIQSASPIYSQNIGGLIYQTASEVWSYLFGSDGALFDRYVSGLWSLPHNMFSHTEAFVLSDTHEGVVCGLELGCRGDTKTELGNKVGTARDSFLTQKELAAISSLERGMGYLTPAVPDSAYYLQFFSVAPTHQGRGLGSRLMEHCISRARRQNCRSIHLDVTTHNPAVNVYKASGFYIAAETRLPEKDTLPSFYRMVKSL